MEKIGVVGLGYIGLPTALVAAQHGFRVIGYDIDSYRVKCINSGVAPIHEPGIGAFLQKALEEHSFCATTKLEPADCFIIAVPTPFKDKVQGSAIKHADLSFVWSAASAVAKVLQKGNTVILESTVPVGTTHKLALFLENATGLRAGVEFYCAYSPERVLPGRIFHELIHNDRIIGGINAESGIQAQCFYARFVQGKIHRTSAPTAEMVKLVENSSRDVALAFAYQVADMAQAMEIDAYEVIELANKHPRVKILQPRCGVGGHCIAVDPWFLIETFPAQSMLLQTARIINDQRPFQIMQQIYDYRKQYDLEKPYKTLVLGVTYKPNVDDIRESPALFIAQQLAQKATFQVKVCDPFCALSTLASHGIYEMTDLAEGIAWADLVVVLVDHTFFKEQRELIKTHPAIMDFCGLLYEPHHEQETAKYVFKEVISSQKPELPQS